MDKRSVRRGVVVIDELESNFGKFVYLGDSYTPSDEDDDNSDEEEEGSEEIEPYGPELVKKCTKKCAESDDEPETSMQLLFSEGHMKPKLPVAAKNWEHPQGKCQYHGRLMCMIQFQIPYLEL
ncbi:unnamed protein product [Cuscuta europaea]|uniref:Uncharacterized protein n=1 Tax=Cuscuta europaea TaxID=41803 RepID=A0A9P0ZTC2_CUSEU|nr:unnamed protein product [Cuscuta europaea]